MDIGFVETLWQDLRYGTRLLRVNPGFAFIALASLALGIGVNTAIFQLLDAVRLRTLPVKNPQELALVRIADLTGARGSFNSSYPALTNPLWERIRDHQQAFSGVLAWAREDFNLALSGEAHNARGLWVSGDFFRVLGVQPILGRAFSPADDYRGCGAPGAVITYPFWKREFAGDRSAVGRKLTLNGHPVQIIGITPENFFGLEMGQSFDLAVPICSQATLNLYNRLDAGTLWWLTVMGRLKPGWSLKQATAHLNAISPAIFEATLPHDYPPANVKNYLGFKLAASAAGNGVSWLREKYSDPLVLMLAIAGLVLLIACANLANLMLARATAREREIAVRLALGASRGRLIRQLLAESLLIAMAGAALGAFLAQSLSCSLVSFISTQGNPLFFELRADWRVLAFTTSLAVLTCLLFGLTPALQGTHTTPGAVLKAGGRGMTASRERFGLRRALVASQVALSLVLLVGALLFSRSLRNLLTVDTGFQQDGIVIAYVDLTPLNLLLERRHAFDRQLLESVRTIPGIDAAAEVRFIPVSGGATENKVWIDGTDARSDFEPYFNWVSPGYFNTLRIPLLAGRDFNARDIPESPHVAVVNEAFARRLGIADDPIGKRFRRETTPSEPETVFEIVGLVKNAKYRDLREDFPPIAFLAAPQMKYPDQYPQILIRSAATPAGVIPAVKQAIGNLSPKIAFEFQIFKTQIREGLLREQLMAMLSGFFGFLAASLAAIGLYGVISYMVAQRRNEIGIRMALGANRGDVMKMIMREAMLLLAAGLIAGAVLTLAAARTVSSMLFGLKPHDMATLMAAAGLLAAVSAAASYLPARRAARLDPMTAIRDE